MVREIGSFYPIYPENQESTISDNADALLRFSLCREALLLIAQQCATAVKRVLLPAYTCQTVIAPFVQEGWQCAFYPLDKNLRIDTAALLALAKSFRPTLCVVHPYFGNELNRNELDALAVLKSLDCSLVEDRTQILFSQHYNELFDFFVGSYRKWFPIPDGAFLKLGKSACSIPTTEMSENEKFVQLTSAAMFLRGVFLNSGDENVKTLSRTIENQAAAAIGSTIEVHRMSDFSLKRLAMSEVAMMGKRRMDNYHFLYQHLINNEIVKPVKEDLSELTTVPLYFPVYAKDRASLQTKLCARRIYAPILWPVQTSDILINDTIREIFGTILMIPCDQRYTDEDMQFIVDVVNS